MIWRIVGSAAAFLTMLSFVPQIAKSLKTKSVRDISIITMFQLSLGVSLWILYGLYLKDPIIIIANGVTLASLVVLISLYFIFGKDG